MGYYTSNSLTGSRNVLIGSYIGSSTSSYNDAIIIGHNATPLSATSFQINIGNTIYGRTNTGNVMIGTTTDAGFKLDVNGTARVNSELTVFKGLTSSGRIATFYGYQAPYQLEASIEVGMQQTDAGVPVGIAILGGSNIQTLRGGFLEARSGRRAISFNDLGIVSIGTTQISSSQYSTLTVGAAAVSIGSLLPNKTGIQLAVISKDILMTGSLTGQTEVSFNSFAVSSLRVNIFATTYTNAYNVYIDGEPIAGQNVTFTNKYSLYVNSGKTYFGGNVLIGKTTDSGQKLQVSGDTLLQGSLTANTISATTLIVSGTYGGISTITNKPNLFDVNGTARVDWSTGVLNSIANDTTVDWENKILYDSGAVASIDWENKILSSPNYVALEYSNDETISSQLYPRYVIPETVQRSVTNNVTPSGQIIEATIQAGTTDYSLIYLDTDGTWKPLKNLPIVSTKMLGICISQSNSQVLIEGDIGVSDDNSQGAYITGADHGLPVYVSGTNGIMTVTVPTSGVVRVVGHIYYQSPTDANWWLMKFRPSNSWYEI